MRLLLKLIQCQMKLKQYSTKQSLTVSLVGKLNLKLKFKLSKTSIRSSYISLSMNMDMATIMVIKTKSAILTTSYGASKKRLQNSKRILNKRLINQSINLITSLISGERLSRRRKITIQRRWTNLLRSQNGNLSNRLLSSKKHGFGRSKNVLKILKNNFKRKCNNSTKTLTICISKIIKAMDINKTTTIFTMDPRVVIDITKTIVTTPEVAKVGIMDTMMLVVMVITGLEMVQIIFGEKRYLSLLQDWYM